mmetsp:Transcript_11913/g.28233  ORF Transcript_11913/g.28233 Transcript_11913/m.28233 type:complete len:169 (+) Transcript_11913:421-927(+)
MKNPTAIELWNFLMIMVPPILNVKSITADQIDVKDSLKPRVDITAQDIRASIPVNPKIEYHHPAIRRLDEPPHRESARSDVYVDREALMIPHLYLSAMILPSLSVSSLALIRCHQDLSPSYRTFALLLIFLDLRPLTTSQAGYNVRRKLLTKRRILCFSRYGIDYRYL